PPPKPALAISTPRTCRSPTGTATWMRRTIYRERRVLPARLPAARLMLPPTSEPRRCHHCGAEPPAGVTTCPQCWHELDEPPPVTWRDRFMESGAYSILVAFMLVSAVLSVVYRIIEKRELTQTYATFVGIPLLIGVMTAYFARPRSSLATVMKIT